MTRIQTGASWDTKEDQEALMKKTGNPSPHYEQAALFKSIDGGRTFRMPEGGVGPWYGHRGTINWFQSNVLVVTHHWGGSRDERKVARISLDGGKTWINGTKSGTPMMNKSTKFVVDPNTSFTCPTIERSKNHFLSTIWRWVGKKGEIIGVSWNRPARNKPTCATAETGTKQWVERCFCC